MRISDDIERFILDQLIVDQDIVAIGADESLLSRSIIDSHGLMELISYLEERYGVSIGPDDLDPANFESLASIEAFLANRGHNRA